MSQIGDYELVEKIDMEDAMADLGMEEHPSDKGSGSDDRRGNPLSGLPRSRFGTAMFRSGSVASLGHNSGYGGGGPDDNVSMRGSVRSLVSRDGNRGEEGFPRNGEYPAEENELADDAEKSTSGEPRALGGEPREIWCYKCRKNGHHYRNCQNGAAPAVAARNRLRKQNLDAFMAAESRFKERVRQDRMREDDRLWMRQRGEMDELERKHREARLALEEKRVREDRARQDDEKDRLRLFRNSR